MIMAYNPYLNAQYGATQYPEPPPTVGVGIRYVRLFS